VTSRIHIFNATHPLLPCDDTCTHPDANVEIHTPPQLSSIRAAGGGGGGRGGGGGGRGGEEEAARGGGGGVGRNASEEGFVDTRAHTYTPRMHNGKFLEHITVQGGSFSMSSTDTGILASAPSTSTTANPSEYIAHTPKVSAIIQNGHYF